MQEYLNNIILLVMCAQIACSKDASLPGISCGQKSSQAGHRGSVLPLKYLATHGLCIFMPQVGFSQIWHWGTEERYSDEINTVSNHYTGKKKHMKFDSY